MGVCASPDGVALPVGPTVPVPTAYFPLTNGSTFSWPIPEYWAYNTSAIQSKQTKFVKDSYFGTVVQCNASLGELQYHDALYCAQVASARCCGSAKTFQSHTQQVVVPCGVAQMLMCLGFERMKQYHCRVQPGD